MPSDSEKRQFSWRGSRKISAKLPILHVLRHVCGIGGHTRTEKCLWQFSLQMHCNVSLLNHRFRFILSVKWFQKISILKKSKLSQKVKQQNFS